MEWVKGTFINQIYVNESNGYVVGLLRVKESSNPDIGNKVITFTGVFGELKYKANYKMMGEFVNHNKYGLQFQVTSYELVMPTDFEELVTFLSSELFPIGEKTAQKIVDKLGRDAINIIISNPDSLMGIPRLKKEKIDLIVETLEDYQSTNQIVIELNKMGFSTKNAITLLKKYDSQCLDKANDNIYQFLDDIDISFWEIDKIARSNGYDLNDERRLLALTIYMMNDLTFNNGDTYLYFDEMYKYMKGYTDDLSEELFEYILLKLSKLDKIVIVKNRYYLYEFYEAENYIVNRLVKLNNEERRKLPKLDKKINALELVMGITYDDSQKDAIMKALNNNLTIITGGPGTGKTTIIKCITRLLTDLCDVKSGKIALLAPTGRAARKLMETTNIPAYTIHKYLGWDKELDKFKVDEFNPNREEYIIVDEASMIDTILMASLLRGTTLRAKYILVGDYYQLPSVSQGQVLKDLIDSKCLDVVSLKQLYRQTEDSYITTLAYEVKNKCLSENYLYKYDDYNFITCNDDEILNIIEDIILKAVKKGYTERDIQVLAPLYKGLNGIDMLNKRLQKIFNPKDANKNEITSGDVIYREGDKILQLVNDPDNGISNGDLGYIESIDKKQVVINFDGNMVTYTPKDFINITHGYAISVHKSQGGEFKMVIMPFTKSFKRMLYNKLVYTAITRAKQTLILIGDSNAFLYGVNNDYIELRKTTIRELLEKKYN